MIKKLLIILFLSNTILIACAQKGNYYVMPTVMLRKALNFSSPVAGGGMTGGVNVSDFGIGAGAEAFSVYKNGGVAIPLFVDLRYHFPGSKQNGEKASRPFIALNIGKLFWNYTESHGAPTDNFTTKYGGKYFAAADLGFLFSKKSHSGIVGAIGYRIYGVSSSGIHRTSITPSGATGPLVETQYPTYNSNYSELVLKIGYTF